MAAIQNQIYLESSEPTEDSRFKSHAHVSQPKSFRIDPELVTLLLPPDPAKVSIVGLGDAERPKYLWGQYNRFFPVKIAMRAAANLISQHESEWISLDELQEKSAEAARLVGKQVEKMDRQYGRKRGTIISAALPVGRNADKAKLRFKNQFVGYIMSKVEHDSMIQRVYGAAPALKFLEIKKSEKNSVQAGITDFGLKFACCSNPIIDQQDFSTALSSEEVEFLLGHIASEIPEEARLIQVILEGVRKGIATPLELNESIQAYRAWKGKEAAMMRAGLVGRIGELGLLERRKDGVKVTYLLTDLGEKYVQRLSAVEA